MLKQNKKKQSKYRFYGIIWLISSIVTFISMDFISKNIFELSLLNVLTAGSGVACLLIAFYYISKGEKEDDRKTKAN